VPTKHAEAITSAITEVLNDSLESISESFVSKAEMQKVTPHIACLGFDLVGGMDGLVNWLLIW
jgi:hypothetical protein